MKGFSLSVKKKSIKPSIFGVENDEDDPVNYQEKVNRELSTLTSSSNSNQEFVSNDPNVSSYDEIYDSFKPKVTTEVVREPKYMDSLLKAAEERKRERERRNERQLAKLREQEDEQGETEKFVTFAYQQKLKEIKELEIKERIEQEEEESEVKQFSSFHRNILNQRVDENAKLKVQKEKNNIASHGLDEKESEGKVKSEHQSKQMKHKDSSLKEIQPKKRELNLKEEGEIKDLKSPKKDLYNVTMKKDSDAISSARERYLARKTNKSS